MEIEIILHVVDNIGVSNSGIINSAVATSEFLQSNCAIKTIICFPLDPGREAEVDFGLAQPVSLSTTNKKSLVEVISRCSLSPSTTLIITHGAWQFPTRWGAEFRRRGYKWIYTPHGMLEPWSLTQNRFVKWLYFLLLEGRLGNTATVVRATSTPERENLAKKFANITLISNGVKLPVIDTAISQRRFEQRIGVLFMARLHYKKGVMPLVRAWRRSELYDNNGYELVILGNDDGDLKSLMDFISTCGSQANIRYMKTAFGERKSDILRQCAYYVLPSLSEGFPTSVVDAMSHGLIPMITQGCNFPEAIEARLAIPISTDEVSLTSSLNEITGHSKDYRVHTSKACIDFIEAHYSCDAVAVQILKYTSLIE